MNSFTGWGIERYKIMKKAMLQIQQTVEEMILTKQDSEVFALALIEPTAASRRFEKALKRYGERLAKRDQEDIKRINEILGLSKEEENDCQ